MAKHAAALNLLEQIATNEVKMVEEFLHLGDSLLWRQLIRYEFPLEQLSHAINLSSQILVKLLAYEIRTLCCFHVAAMLGHNDCLMTLMEKDIPVDLAVTSGTTALHLACFAGKLETVKLLMEVYKADIHRIDRYGWTALHYSCTEGHLEIVKLLVAAGIDITGRDQDGTTACYRARVNHHEDVVNFLLRLGFEDEQLNIDESQRALPEDVNPAAGLYSKVDKQGKEKRGQEATAGAAENHVTTSSKGDITDAAMFMNLPDRNRRASEPCTTLPPGGGSSTTQRPRAAPRKATSGSKTLPHKTSRRASTSDTMRKDKIRRLIRKELEITFGDEYETPVSGSGSGMSTIFDEVELREIGVNTLTGLMREEFEKYKNQQTLQRNAASRTGSEASMDDEVPVQNKDDSDYEDLYACLANLPPAPQPPPPPPALPPRNPNMSFNNNSSDKYVLRMPEPPLTTYSLSLGPRDDTGNTALNESFQKLAPLLGRDWKKLAHALPLEATPTKVDQRITAIVERHPTAVTQQAFNALAEWRLNKGKDASVDSLIIALRKCSLHPLIPEVEKVTQEFTA